MLRPGWGMDTLAGVCFLLIYVLSPPREQMPSRLGTWGDYIGIALVLAAGFAFRFLHMRWSPEWRSRVALWLLFFAGGGAAWGDFVIPAAIVWSASLPLLLREAFRNKQDADSVVSGMYFGFWIVMLCVILFLIGGVKALGGAFAVAWVLLTVGNYQMIDERNEEQEPLWHAGLFLFHGVIFTAALWWTATGVLEAVRSCGHETVCQTLPHTLESVRCELRCFVQEFFSFFLLDIIALSVVIGYTIKLGSYVWRRWIIRTALS